MHRLLNPGGIFQVGGLVGGGDSELLGILRPYYSVVDMSANGNKQVESLPSLSIIYQDNFGTKH